MKAHTSKFIHNDVHLDINPKTTLKRMRHLLKYILLLGTGTLAYGQMGINTKNPHPSSVLDITSDVPNGNVGVLFPQVTTAQRLSPTLKPTDRLLVYDNELQMFMYYLSGKWYALNGSKTTVTSRNGGKDTLSVHTGTAVFATSKPDSSAVKINGDMELNGKLKGNLSTTGNITGQKVYGEGTMPAGAIIMWSGNINNIPQGWALCDGGGGRPDLRGRFIVGYDPNDPDYNSTQKVGPTFTDADGTSNGNNTQDAKQLRLLSTQSGLPSHSHNVKDPGHFHDFRDRYHNREIVGKNLNSGEEAVGMSAAYDNSKTKDALTGITLDNANAQDASLQIENRPPYYVLAYIIKLNY